MLIPPLSAFLSLNLLAITQSPIAEITSLLAFTRLSEKSFSLSVNKDASLFKSRRLLDPNPSFVAK